MKKILLFLMLVVASIAFAEVYQVGNTVAEFNFQDSNVDAGGNVVTTNQTIHSIIDAGQVLVLNFAGKS